MNDLNDNQPVFPVKSYTISIPEHSEFGTEAKLADQSDYDYIYANDQDKIDRGNGNLAPCSVGFGNGDLKYLAKSDWFDVETCFDKKTDRYYARFKLKSTNSSGLDREKIPKNLNFTLTATDQVFKNSENTWETLIWENSYFDRINIIFILWRECLNILRMQIFTNIQPFLIC